MRIFIDEKPAFNDLPWLTDSAIDFLQNHLTANQNLVMLEFGTGSSTLWFSKRVKKLVSIEHDVRWHPHVQAELAKQGCTNVDYRLIRSKYYNECDTFADNYFDLILIDGKDRVECVEHCMRILKPGGILMLDNAERPIYKPIYEMLNDWQFFKTTQIGKSKLGFEQENWQTNWWIKPITTT